MAKNSLIEKAILAGNGRTRPETKRKPVTYSDDELQLAIAWAQGKVTSRGVGAALWGEENLGRNGWAAPVMYSLALLLRRCVETGKLS